MTPKVWVLVVFAGNAVQSIEAFTDRLDLEARAEVIRDASNRAGILSTWFFTEVVVQQAAEVQS